MNIFSKYFLLFSRLAFLGLLSISSHMHSVIIVAHGTFAAFEPWHQADGDFVKSLKENFVHLPDGCSQKNASIVSFGWTGANCSQARIAAAKNLVSLMLSYPIHEPIHLIMHSHAGNIAALATHLLKNNPEASRDFSVSSDAKKCEELVGLPCSEQDCRDLQQAFLETSFLYASQLQAVRSIVDVGVVQKKISTIYFLGTPVDAAKYSCDMDVVDRCYALFSSGDWVQPVGGFYKRIFPQTKRLLNIEVVRVVSKKRILKLGHCELRKPLVGNYLLRIPYLIADFLNVAPEQFDDYKNVVLVLFADGLTPVIVSSLFEKDGKLNAVVEKRLQESIKKPPAQNDSDGGDFIDSDLYFQLL